MFSAAEVNHGQPKYNTIVKCYSIILAFAEASHQTLMCSIYHVTEAVFNQFVTSLLLRSVLFLSFFLCWKQCYILLRFKL